MKTKRTQQPKQAPANRWWFEGASHPDERCWHHAEKRWHWWNEALPRMSAEYRKFAWRDGCERAAFVYEMARRATVELLRLPTYPELTYRQREGLKQSCGIADARWVARSRPEPGYAACPHFWNLRETPTAMWKCFTQWLESEREKQGIPHPKARPTMSRPVAWRWIEILDAPRNLTDADRSILAKARCRARNCADQIRPLLIYFPAAR